MVRKMSDDDVLTFMDAPARIGHIATVRPDGRPHVATIWYAVDGRDIVFMTDPSNRKAKNLAANPRAAFSVDDPVPPYTAVTVEGPVEGSTDEAEARRWALKLAAKYHGEAQAEEFAVHLVGATVYRLTPAHITGLADMEDASTTGP